MGGAEGGVGGGVGGGAVGGGGGVVEMWSCMCGHVHLSVYISVDVGLCVYGWVCV